MKQVLFGLLAVFFFLPSLHSQKEKTSVSIIDFNIPSVKTITKLKETPSFKNKYLFSSFDASQIHRKIASFQARVTEVFSTDSRFVVVDRKSSALISKERDLQKMEDFLDGYVVEQGKSIGAEYLVSGEFNATEIILTLSLYDVGKGAIVSTEVIDMRDHLFGVFDNVGPPVKNGTRRMIEREFPLLMSVVKILESKKDKAKLLLIAGGLNRGIKNGQLLDIKISEILEVEGVKNTYYKTVGLAVVEKIEGPNFSVVYVDDGKEEVKSYFDSGQKLYCTFKIENE
jgi:hypothetical protein